MSDRRDQVIQVRASKYERATYQARAKRLGVSESDLARRGLKGHAVDDLLILREAIRLLDCPPEAIAAWTTFACSFGVVSDGVWPGPEEAKLIRKWADWAQHQLDTIGPEASW